MNIKMKILFVVIIVIFVIVGAIICFRQKVMGNMSDDIKEVKTSSSDFTFYGSKGDRIKVSLRTTVRDGIIDFVLTDSKGNVVVELDRAKALETFVDLNYDDAYTLTAIYKDFTGRFYAKISKKIW